MIANSTADRAAPGELLRLVADGLTGAGLAGHRKQPRAGRTATRPGAPRSSQPREDPCPQEPQP